MRLGDELEWLSNAIMQQQRIRGGHRGIRALCLQSVVLACSTRDVDVISGDCARRWVNCQRQTFKKKDREKLWSSVV